MTTKEIKVQKYLLSSQLPDHICLQGIIDRDDFVIIITLDMVKKAIEGDYYDIYKDSIDDVYSLLLEYEAGAIFLDDRVIDREDMYYGCIYYRCDNYYDYYGKDK